MSENTYYSIDNIKIGYGNFNLPPIMIGTLFYQGQTLIVRKNSSLFDSLKAKKRIDTQIELSKQYKLPNLIEISANEPNSMPLYLKFFLEHYEPPFVLGGTYEARIEGLRYLRDNEVDPKHFIYHAVSNLKNPSAVE
ncbi:MAG: hypothetical protein P8Y23_12325, partial [Candidatus Lokiarchaeota archaeon]